MSNNDKAMNANCGAARSLPWGKWTLITLGLSFLGIVVVFPLVNIFYQAFVEGVEAFWLGIQTPDALHALSITLIATLVAVPLNTAFGILAAWMLARHSLPGKTFLLGILDLPLTISPVIVGLMFILLFSQTDSIFKEWVLAWNLKIIFATPGIILTTTFITLPYVAREVLPALQTLGVEQEEVANTLVVCQH